MSDPRSAGTASPPPTLGEGCTNHCDIDALDGENGTEFPGAAGLWRHIQESANKMGEANAEDVLRRKPRNC